MKNPSPDQKLINTQLGHIRSPDLRSLALIGKPLTNRKIDQYSLAGYYGSERQSWTKRRVEEKKAKTQAKREKFLKVKAILDELLA